MAKARPLLDGRTRDLFDFICAAGELGWRLPDDKIDLQAAAGARDPRRRLAKEFPQLRSGVPKTWAAATARLGDFLLKKLRAAELSEQDRGLRILLAYVTIALAPDNVVPSAPLPRAAWDLAVELFENLFAAQVKAIGALACVESRLSQLQHDAVAGMQVGRLASGQRPGSAGCDLAVDREFIDAISRKLRKKLAPGYMARHLFYAKAGDHIWPHPDDPKFAATVLTCISHQLPAGAARRSAFLAYRADGSVERYEIKPGETLAVEPGRVHAREPVVAGEEVALLSIGLVRA
ncbi:MAG: hypothetical protein M3R59_00335 [Verrucomicrobiota bacterium]|nr:hypothetical protein [Verrucomicrobiota bacterium]